MQQYENMQYCYLHHLVCYYDELVSPLFTTYGDEISEENSFLSNSALTEGP